MVKSNPSYFKYIYGQKLNDNSNSANTFDDLYSKTIITKALLK